MQDLLKVPRLMMEVERHVPVNDITYRGLRVWPFLRTILTRDIFWEKSGAISDIPQENPQTEFFEKNTAPLFESFYDKLTVLFMNLLGPNVYRKPDFLFLSRGYEYTLVDGKNFNKQFDPLKEILNEMGRNHLDLLAPYDNQDHEPRHQPSINIASLIQFSMGIAQLKRQSPKRPSIQNLKSLATFLKERKISAPLEHDSLADQLECVLEYQQIFERMLKVLSPKVVMMVSFYNDVLFGLCAACNRLGIPTVDVQHGFLQSEELIMGNWTQVPPEGYELFPNYFWAWGDESCPAFDSWTQKSEHNLIPITGGNLWMTKNIQALPKVPPREQGIDRVILFTLQQTPFNNACDLIPQVVREALKHAPSSWRWVFRLHYKMGDDIYKLIQEYIAPYENRVQLERACERALYSSMQSADYHVSQTSTTIVEAETLKLPNILAGPDAKIFYAKEIQEGIYFHVTEPDEFIRIITDKLQPAQRKNPIIELDAAVAKRALQNLLHRTPVSHPNRQEVQVA